MNTPEQRAINAARQRKSRMNRPADVKAQNDLERLKRRAWVKLAAIYPETFEFLLAEEVRREREMDTDG